MTPTLSVEADHESVTEVVVFVADSEPGVVGGVTSGGVASVVTDRLAGTEALGTASIAVTV